MLTKIIDLSLGPNDSADGFSVIISGSQNLATVEIDGLGKIVGVNASPAWALAKWHLEDKSSQIERDDFRFIAGGEISQILGISKGVLRARVKRLRGGFAEFHIAIEGHLPTEPILIKSGNGHSYRIDPYCAVQQIVD